MAHDASTDRFSSFDGIELSYLDSGRGVPVVLLHGFASDSYRNWVGPGVFDAIRATGRRVVALDARGHGASDKPHDEAAYSHRAMVRDVQALLDHLGAEVADVCGYSMGAITTVQLPPLEPRVRSVVLGGIGAGLLDGAVARRAPEIAAALSADDPAAVSGSVARAFRAFAVATGADRAALAALQRSRADEEPWRVERLGIPGVVIAGRGDELVGDPAALAEHIGADAVLVPGNHLTAVLAPEFAEAIVSFLEATRGA